MTRLPSQRRRSPITEKDRLAFLEALEAGWSVKNAAGRTTHGRQRFYEFRESDEAFASAWAEAFDAGTQALEDEARRRAVDGYDESTYGSDGNLIRRVHRYSDALMHRLLAARDPERYGNTRVEVTGPQGKPIVVDHRAGLTLEHLATFAETLRGEQRPDRLPGPVIEQIARPALSPGSPAPAQTHQRGEVHAKAEPPRRDGTLSGE